MKLIFIYGVAGVGKFTVASELSRRTGFALFHNHLVVDAVASVFPFGSDPFVRLRERFWLNAFEEAVNADRSLIFTFAPEPTVSSSFAERVGQLVGAGGGQLTFVRLVTSVEEQERRIGLPDRAQFGKLTSLELFRTLRPQFEAALAAMPEPQITIDTGLTLPEDAAQAIIEAAALEVLIKG